MSSTNMIINALTLMGGTAHFDALMAALPAYDAPRATGTPMQYGASQTSEPERPQQPTQIQAPPPPQPQAQRGPDPAIAPLRRQIEAMKQEKENLIRTYEQKLAEVKQQAAQAGNPSLDNKIALADQAQRRLVSMMQQYSRRISEAQIDEPAVREHLARSSQEIIATLREQLENEEA